MKTWQNELKNCIKTSHELANALNLPEESYIHEPNFPIRAPRRWLTKINPSDAKDPLLLQILARPEENIETPGYESQPLKENQFNPAPGLLHKYPGRVLLTTTQACAIHCRYCFRQNFSYEKNNPSMNEWEQALDYIRNDDSIFEVIFSGGDPLSLNDNTLKQLIQKLETIPHLNTLRFHTRTAIVLPSRIAEALITILNDTRFNVVFVTHCNHANELDIEVKHALQKLKDINVTLLNQSVILKDINDNAETLIKLSKTLHQFGVLPYYLHTLDKVKGTAHFDIAETQAIQLIEKMQASLPGYLVPKLVKEEAGKLHKSNLLAQIGQ